MPDRDTDPDEQPITDPDDWAVVSDNLSLTDAEHTAALAIALYRAALGLDLDRERAERFALRGTRIAHQYRAEQQRWQRIAAAEQLPPWEPERAGSDAHPDLREPAGRATDGDDPPGRDAPVQPAGGEPGAGAPDLPGGGAVPAGAEPNRITDYPSYLHAEPLAHTDYDHTHTARLTNARLQHTGGARGHTHPGYRRDVPRSTNTYVYPGDPA